MPLSTTTARVSYAGNGSTTAFSFPYKYLNHDDFWVQLELISSGAKTTQTLDADYTVTTTAPATNGVYPGATITFTTAPSALYNVIITRTPPLTQEFDFDAEADPLPVITRHADYVEMKLQALALNTVDAVGDSASDLFAYTSLLGPTPRTAKQRANDRPHIFDWIPAGDHASILLGTNDNAFGAEVQQALDDLVDGGYLGSILYASGGIINLDLPIVFPTSCGLGIEGAGLANSLEANATRFVAVHTSGPVFQLTEDSQLLRNFVIDADGTRQAAAAGSNYGILIEPPDTSDGSANACLIEHVGVRKQPNVGVLQSGNCNHAAYLGVKTRENLGHGFQLDDGTLRGRSNIARPGMNSLNRCRSYLDSGHALVAGNVDTYGFYRLDLINFETASGVDDTKLLQPNQVWLHGENATVQLCAFYGRRGTPAVATFGGLSISGRCHRVINNRFIGTTQPVNVRREDSTSGRETRDIRIDGCLLSSDCTADPLVAVASGCQEIDVYQPNTDGVTSYITAGVTGGRYTSSTIVDDSLRQYTVQKLTAAATSNYPIVVSRDAAQVGFEVVRTGSGAATGVLEAVNGNIETGSTSDVDVVGKRNSVNLWKLITGAFQVSLKLNLADGALLTIASGAITITNSRHPVDTESGAASDDLDTINGGSDGDVLFLRINNNARSVVVKDGTGNIDCSGDRTLNNTKDVMQLMNRNGTWVEVVFTSNA